MVGLIWIGNNYISSQGFRGGSFSSFSGRTITQSVIMVVKQFYLLGEPSSTARNVEFEEKIDFEGLQHWIAGQFAIVEANGMFNEVLCGWQL